jgi:hypothetical protein
MLLFGAVSPEPVCRWMAQIDMEGAMSIPRATVVIVGLHLLAGTGSAQPRSDHSISVGRVGYIDEAGPWYVSGGGARVRTGGVLLGGDMALASGRTRPDPVRPAGTRYRQFLGSMHVGAMARGRAVEPFVTTGISLVTGARGPRFGWNVGAGAIVPVRGRVGVRVDARLIGPFRGEGGLWTVGAGMTFHRPSGP